MGRFAGIANARLGRMSEHLSAMLRPALPHSPGLKAGLPGALLERRLSVAPMMDWTDRHCRYYLRLWSPSALLYTEMIVADAIVRGDTERLLGFDPAEQPVALQLGGSEPAVLARAARIGAEFGYREINLNCGCPSDRVQRGTFGACLMREPARVAEAVAAMKAAVGVPVTVKCRIGVDDEVGDAFLGRFVAPLVAAGVDALVVHARAAILKGLSPKDNREIPPLDYGVVYRLKEAYPDLPVVLNGGLKTVADVEATAGRVDGVMLGREAYHRPSVLAEIDVAQGRAAVAPGPEAVLAAFLPYVERELARGTRLHSMTRHVLGHYAGLPGARAFRRTLSLASTRPAAGAALLLAAERAARERPAA
jgi:tRNA-dihydrouridine synthase A